MEIGKEKKARKRKRGKLKQRNAQRLINDRLEA
jgi:hypothetical protein